MNFLQLCHYYEKTMLQRLTFLSSQHHQYRQVGAPPLPRQVPPQHQLVAFHPRSHQAPEARREVRQQ